MKLISIKIIGKGSGGWDSEELIFANHVTQIWGPNGCGKTPIIQSIAFCLGYPCVFREDIYNNCHYALLTIEVNSKKIEIKRYIESKLNIEVTENNKNVQQFYNEGEYSSYLFELLGLDLPNIVSKSNFSAKPYLATLLPVVYLDQDNGYSSHYHSESNFIKDQFDEMIRVLFSLPPKNSFDKKRKRIEEKEILSNLDNLVESTYKKFKLQKEKTDDIQLSSLDIYNEIKSLDEELVALKETYSGHDDSLNALDRIIQTHRKTIRGIESEISEITYRNQGICKVIGEINTEIDTLNLNEEARRVFITSSEICSSDNCGLFSKSSESYSKNLLYLRDQIKDLERNTAIDERKLTELKNRKLVVEELIKEIVIERNEAVNRSEASVLVDTISEIKNQLFELQGLHDQLELKEKLERKYFEAMRKRDQALDRYNALSNSKQSIPELVKLKTKLRDNLVKWIDSIRTINVSLNIKWKKDFVPLFGNETIEQIKGSTKTRIVLAYHAALMELMLEQKANGINFFILDTPKQHEIHDDDLDNFLKTLKELCEKYSLQVIFSATEYKYEGNSNDRTWVPSFPGERQNMFLKPRVII